MFVVDTVSTNWLTSQKVALLRKKVMSGVGHGSDSMAVVGDKLGGCGVDVGGIDGDIVVAGVAIAAGFDVVAFFADFFLLKGAGMVYMG